MDRTSDIVDRKVSVDLGLLASESRRRSESWVQVSCKGLRAGREKVALDDRVKSLSDEEAEWIGLNEPYTFNSDPLFVGVSVLAVSCDIFGETVVREENVDRSTDGRRPEFE